MEALLGAVGWFCFQCIGVLIWRNQLTQWENFRTVRLIYQCFSVARWEDGRHLPSLALASLVSLVLLLGVEVALWIYRGLGVLPPALPSPIRAHVQVPLRDHMASRKLL